MKKLAITAVSFMIIIWGAMAQPKKNEIANTKNGKTEHNTVRIPLKKLEGTQVSDLALASFKVDFGDIKNAQWKRNGTFDEAVYMKSGKRYTAFYDDMGKLVGTTTSAALSDLPEKAQQDIKTRYKDYHVGPVVYFEDNEANETEMVMYGIQFDDADTWLVELSKGNKGIVVQVDKAGSVSFFKQL
jgi:hypothetical protein